MDAEAGLQMRMDAQDARNTRYPQDRFSGQALRTTCRAEPA